MAPSSGWACEWSVSCSCWSSPPPAQEKSIWHLVSVEDQGFLTPWPACKCSFRPLHRLLPQTSHNLIIYLYSWVDRILSLDWPPLDTAMASSALFIFRPCFSQFWTNGEECWHRADSEDISNNISQRTSTRRQALACVTARRIVYCGSERFCFQMTENVLEVALICATQRFVYS